MMTETLRQVELFTDGACTGNPGPGGWGFILRDTPTGKEIRGSGGEPETTNNRMEMLAVINGLEALKASCRVILTTDSQYVTKGISEWLAGWKANGWRRREGGRFVPVKNVELWQRLDSLLSKHSVECRWVRGHIGHAENEECDRMAVAAYQEFLKNKRGC